jgi:hypothetical protein
MFKNEMLQMIINLQKKGTHIHLTEEGYREFIGLLQEEFADEDNILLENLKVAVNQ